MQRVDDYSLANYGAMITDRVRMPAYADALRRAIAPGAVVVDIGAGTGICSFLAVQAGARRVYAIEPNDAIETAREIAEANGLADHIVFLKTFSIEVDLPELADVIVSDLRGLLPLHTTNLASIIDARERFLAPGGVLIPQQDVLWVGLIESAEVYESIVGPPAERCFGLDMSAAHRNASSRTFAKEFEPSDLLGEPAPWASLEYPSLESSDATGAVTLAPSRQGTLHGLVAWFATDLFDGIGYSTGPGNATVYRSCFFPLPEPVPVSPKDLVSVRLEARCVGGQYVWRWKTHVAATEGPTRVAFEQSDLLPPGISLDRLRRRSEDHVVRLADEGRVAARALELIAAATSHSARSPGNC